MQSAFVMTSRIAAGALLSLGSVSAMAAGDLAQFRESASLALVEIGLRDMPAGAYACVSVDDRLPSDEQLAAFRALRVRDVGGPGACVCVEGDPAGRCTRAANGQQACVVSVRAFELQYPDHASAELLVLCGWPKGSGQFADFEKRDGQWRYVGARTYIKL
jgi:hypothetical protein